MSDETYHDNVLVRSRPNSGEFLDVGLNAATEDGDAPVRLCRYVVPGRTDVYTFDWVPGHTGVGERVRYFSDHGLPLAAALAMLVRDLNKKAVVEMLVQACRNPQTYLAARLLVHELLPVLAPKSVSLRECNACIAEIRAEHRKRIEQQAAQRRQG